MLAGLEHLQGLLWGSCEADFPGRRMCAAKCMAEVHIKQAKPSFLGRSCELFRAPARCCQHESNVSLAQLRCQGNHRCCCMMQVIELGQHVHDGQAEQRVYALVGPGETPSVHLLPDGPDSLALLNASSTPLHFWRLNATTGGLAYPASTSTHASLAAAMQDSLHAKITVATHLLLPRRANYSGSAFK